MFFLTQADVDFLKMLKKRHDDGNIGNHIRTQEIPGEDAQAPEVFLVQLIEDIGPSSVGTGTDAGTGTSVDDTVVGTAYWGLGNRLRIDSTTDEIAVQNDSRLFVYNPYSSAISQGTVCLAVRDKNGHYILVQSGTGAIIVQFSIITMVDRKYATANILRRPAGINSVPEEVNGVITVWDRNKPKFLSEPSILLPNRRGTAVWMEYVGQAPEWVIIGLDCPDSNYDDDVDDYSI